MKFQVVVKLASGGDAVEYVHAPTRLIAMNRAADALEAKGFPCERIVACRKAAA